MRQLKITQSITRRDERSLEKYLNEINKYDLLSIQEEERLFKKVQEGNEEALQRVINANLRFVVSVAKQYHFKSTWLGDLVNEGNIGLIKAAHRFDPTRGFKFISYAVWWIRQSILNHLNERRRKIRLPANFQTHITSVKNAERSFLQLEERLPTIEEIAQLTGLSQKVILKCQENYRAISSLDRKVNNEDDTTLIELMEDHSISAPDHQVAVRETQQQEVAYLLDTLPQRDASILKWYYGINQGRAISLNDIGKRMGVSSERARQIRDKALKRLRRKHKALTPTLSNV